MPYAPGTTKRGACSFDLDQVLEWMRKVGRTGENNAGRPIFSTREMSEPAEPEPLPELSPADSEEAGKLSQLAASELARLRVAVDVQIKRLEVQRRERLEQEASGELVSRQKVLDRMARMILSAKSRLESLPGSLAPRLVGLDDEQAVSALLLDGIEGALAALSAEAALEGDL